MLAFAIAPGLSVALGGILNSHYGWESCFYAGTVYGAILLAMVRQLPETQKNTSTRSVSNETSAPGICKSI